MVETPRGRDGDAYPAGWIFGVPAALPRLLAQPLPGDAGPHPERGVQRVEAAFLRRLDPPDVVEHPGHRLRGRRGVRDPGGDGTKPFDMSKLPPHGAVRRYFQPSGTLVRNETNGEFPDMKDWCGWFVVDFTLQK